MKLNKKFLLVSIFGLSIFLILGVKNVSAVNTGTVGILPAYPDPNVQFSSSWFIYNLGLGQSKEDAVKVINNQDQTAVVKLYAVDATITNDGGFALLLEDSDKKDIGSWVKLAVNQVEIPPKSDKIIPFVITIPANADIGDHAGGIVLQQLDDNGQTVEGTGVKIVTRVGVRIYETVPGTVTKGFNIIRYDWQLLGDNGANLFRKLIGLDKKTLFFVGVENTGNTKFSPKVSVVIKNIFGRTVGNIANAEVGDVFPKTKTTGSMVTWNGMPILGRYVAHLTIDVGEGIAPQTKDIVIWAFPSKLAIELVFIFIILVLIRLVWQYIKEARKEGMPVYTVEDGDTLPDIAEGLYIKWEKIAAVNEIKKPYHLSIGQKIFLPINNKNYELLKQMYKKKMIELPIRERDNNPRKSKKKLISILIIFVLILTGCGFYYFKYKYKKPQNVPVGQPQIQSNPQPQPENASQTTNGAIKKSSIKVEICTPKGFDSESSQRLQEKLQLIGYQTVLDSAACQRNYGNTTIEYLPGDNSQADIVKNDLGISEQVDEKETAGLNSDILINNQASKDEFIQINDTSAEQLN